MSTGQNIINEIRDELQDTDDTSFGDEELLRRINRGAKEFCARTGCLQSVGNIDTNGTSYSFTLSSNLTNPVMVYAVHFNGTPLSRTYPHHVTQQFGSSSGTPDNSNAWYVFDDKLYIDIIPAAASGSSALNVFYTRTPTDMSTVNSTFDFPDEWDSAIISYALAYCRYTDRDTVLQSTEMARYEAMVQTAWQTNMAKMVG